MTTVALGSCVHVLRDDGELDLRPVESLRAGELVATATGHYASVVKVIVQRSRDGTLPLCTVGGLAANAAQLVQYGSDEWRRIDAFAPAVHQGVRGVACVVLEGAGSIVVDGVRCVAVNAERFRATMQAHRAVRLRLGGSTFRVLG